MKGYSSSQIKAELDAVYGDSEPSLGTVKFWGPKVKRDRTSLVDEERSEWPKTPTIAENIQKIHYIVLDDR